MRIVADDAKMADGGHRDSMHPRIGTLLRVADSGYGAVQGSYGRPYVEGNDGLWRGGKARGCRGTVGEVGGGGIGEGSGGIQVQRVLLGVL